MHLDVAGRRAFAATGGRQFDAALPVVVVLHGAGMDHTVWALQARYLAHHGRAVLAPDLPGHGRSAGPPLASVEEMSDWVAALLDASSVAQASLVGHSLGAAVALETAARHAGRVAALALLGAALAMPVHDGLLGAAREGDPVAFGLVTDWAHGRPAHLGGSTTPGLWLLGGGERLLESEPAGVLGVDLAASNGYAGGAAAAAAVTCPALIIIGEDDRMTPPAAGRKLAAAIPAAGVEVVRGAGHMLMTERPDATLDALLTIV